MKQKKLQTDANTKTSLVLFILAITSLLYLYGCTEKALQLAREKASPQNIEYRKIKGIISAVRQENDDIAVCIELNDFVEKKESKLITIVLPSDILSGDYSTFNKSKFLLEKCQIGSITCFWYPIKKAKSGCETSGSESLLSTSVIPVEEFEIHIKDRNQLYDLLTQVDENRPVAEKIYAVSFMSDTEGRKKKPVSDEAVHAKEIQSGDTVLIYRPARKGRYGLPPISILGAYEDNSTSMYYLLVPVALAADVTAAIVVITVVTFSRCPSCFMGP